MVANAVPISRRPPHSALSHKCRTGRGNSCQHRSPHRRRLAHIITAGSRQRDNHHGATGRSYSEPFGVPAPTSQASGRLMSPPALGWWQPVDRSIMPAIGGFAQLERRLIGERTRAVLAVTKAQGTRLGRESLLPPDLEARVVAEPNQGKGWSSVARTLNVEGVPTTYGGRHWYASTVRGIVLRARGPETQTAKDRRAKAGSYGVVS